jgi:hypothetical protein
MRTGRTDSCTNFAKVSYFSVFSVVKNVWCVFTIGEDP